MRVRPWREIVSKRDVEEERAAARPLALWDYIHDTIASEVYASKMDEPKGWCVEGIADATDEIMALLRRQGLLSEELGREGAQADGD